MGRLRYGMLVSLDGYARDASGSFDWATPDDELHGYVNDQERDVGTLVYGRGMWETMRWWQDSPADDEPGAAREHHDFAAMWREADKVVVSTTLDPPAEPRTELWPTLDLDRLEAAYDAGVLRLTVPVAEKAKPRKIEVTRGSGEQSAITA